MRFRLHGRMIIAITLKDVLDAVRNSRILAALLTPLGMGLLFNFILPDASSARRVAVVVAGGESSAFPAALRGAVGPAVNLVLREVSGPEADRDALRQRRADAGLVLPGGFDAAVRAGQEPELTLLVPDSPGVNTGIVAGALEGALREMAGQRRPATVRQEVVRPQSSGTQTISLGLGPRAYALLLNLVTLVSMIGIFAVGASATAVAGSEPAATPEVAPSPSKRATKAKVAVAADAGSES